MPSITIDLPAWTEGRAVYVFAGIELLAYQEPEGPLMVKVARCSQCGRCCIIRGAPCEHLRPNGDLWECGFFLSRPLMCSAGRGADRVPACTERFEAAP